MEHLLNDYTDFFLPLSGQKKERKLHGIVNTAKTGPGSARFDMTTYFYQISEK